jgi:hypothetical protein
VTGARTTKSAAKSPRPGARTLAKVSAPARKSAAPHSGSAVRTARKPAGAAAKSSSGKRLSYASARKRG